MNVVIRADASSEIGSGHVMRCVTLAERLRQDGARIMFVSRERPGNMSAYLRDRGYEVQGLPSPEGRGGTQGGGADAAGRAQYRRSLGVSPGQDAAETRRLLGQLGLRPDWLIVDHYALDSEWEREVRAHVSRMMVIDDLADRQHDCDVLLDPNLCERYESRYDGRVPAGCTTLLGPRYALLRSEFLEIYERVTQRTGSVRRMLVFFGGSDPTNETEKALQAIRSLQRPGIAVDVVVGGANIRSRWLAEICAEAGNVAFHRQVTNMAELMASADLFVGAAGSTTWERLAVGLPSVVVTIADNQVPIAQYLHQRQMLHYIGKAEDVGSKDIERSIADAIDGRLAAMRCFASCREQVDARGAERVAAVLHARGGH